MDAKKSFVPILITGVVVAFGFAYFMNLGGDTLAASFTDELRSQELVQQKGTERDWRTQEWQETLRLESSDEIQLFGRLFVREASNGDLLVLDSGDQSVKRFSAEGEFLESYGEGRGQGPGEFSTLSDYDVDPSGRVWAADPSNGRITIFDHDATVAQTLRLARPPYRLSLQPDGQGFFIMNPPSSQLFAHFDGEGQERSAFGVFLKDQGVNAMTLDGWIDAMPDGGFVFGARYAGLLAVYDAAGEMRHLVQTVNSTGLPKLIRNGKQTWVDREAPTAMYSMSVTNEGIHVLATEQEGLRLRGAIDTYSLEDGRYLYSRRLPEACEGIHVTDDHLYTISETSITQWSPAAG